MSLGELPHEEKTEQAKVSLGDGRGPAAPGLRAGVGTTNANLIDLVALFDGEKLEWTPRPAEWSARSVFAHLILARYHGPIPSPREWARTREVERNCRGPSGIAEELRISWEMLVRFLSDQENLDSLYPAGDDRSDARQHAPPLLGSVERAAAGFDIGYVDKPERYSGHYIAYHRFAHDLHHRSTLVGYLSQLGVTLDGRRIRPL